MKTTDIHSIETKREIPYDPTRKEASANCQTGRQEEAFSQSEFWSSISVSVSGLPELAENDEPKTNEHGRFSQSQVENTVELLNGAPFRDVGGTLAGGSNK